MALVETTESVRVAPGAAKEVGVTHLQLSVVHPPACNNGREAFPAEQAAEPFRATGTREASLGVK